MSEILKYRVNSQQVIKPHEIDSLLIVENRDLATLLTCHPYRHNYERLLIHGERVD
jgi:sortase A